MPAPMMMVSYIVKGEGGVRKGEGKAASEIAFRPPPSAFPLHLDLFALDVRHQRFEVRDRTVHAREVDVIVLGDLDAVTLAQLHDDVQEVHAVELELLAEGDIVVELRRSSSGAMSLRISRTSSRISAGVIYG